MPKTTYVWDELSDNVIEEYEGGVLTASYSHEPGLYGNLLRQNRSGTTHYYHYDGRGDTVALTNDAGIVTDTKDYDAWGNVIASTGTTPTPYQSAGRIGYSSDAKVTLCYVRARYFSPPLGRWASQDPLGVESDVCLFRYGHNSPVTLLDPSGQIVIEREHSELNKKCGESAFIRWKIQLDNRAPCRGYIVQKVVVRCDATPCPCEAYKTYHAEVDTVYFEAWQMEKNDLSPRSPRDGTIQSYWDRARFQSLKGTCGYSTQYGEARFYCEDKNDAASGGVGTGNLGTYINPGLWKARLTHGSKCPVRTLDLVSTGPSEPDFWKEKPVERTVNPPVDRFLTVDWVCCECMEDRVTAFGEP